jgi:hypothetical protein
MVFFMAWTKVRRKKGGIVANATNFSRGRVKTVKLLGGGTEFRRDPRGFRCERAPVNGVLRHKSYRPLFRGKMA